MGKYGVRQGLTKAMTQIGKKGKKQKKKNVINNNKARILANLEKIQRSLGVTPPAGNPVATGNTSANSFSATGLAPGTKPAGAAPPPVQKDLPPLPSREDLLKLAAKDLKAMMETRGVNATGCLEKAD